MIYAKVDVKLRDHVRAHKAGVAMSTWLWALLYAREQETDGLIPEIALKLSWAGEKDARRHADTLVSVGLWEKHDDGWRICRYEAKNETKEVIALRRTEATERMRRVRANRQRTDTEHTANVRDVNSAAVPGSGSDSGSDLGSREGVQGENAEARYQQAYAAGVSRGKCATWVWPGTKYAGWDLGKIIAGHAKDPNGKGYRGAQLLRFIEATAAEFASDVIASGKAQYYNAFEPRGCLRWLNEHEMAEEARRVG